MVRNMASPSWKTDMNNQINPIILDRLRRYGLEKCVYSDDWYVVTTYDGKVYGDYLKFDPRAEREYQVAFSEVVGMSYER